MHRLFVLALVFTILGISPVHGQLSGSTSVAPPDSSVETSRVQEEAAPVDSRWDAPRSTIDDRADDYVGSYDEVDAPYDRESAVYRAAPPLRYNRVEGLVLGLQRDPLELGQDDHTRAFGQLAYAFQLRDLRYTVGLETQLYQASATDLKIGALYQKQTLTHDRWKTSYLENSLAGFGFRHDFFDYYEAEGVSVYGVQSLPHSVKLTAGFRAEDHRTLDVETNWSIFGDGSFRANPAIDEGRLQAVFASLTAGNVRDLDDLPTGQTLRLSATVADGMGGDFSFYRYVADGRVYVPATSQTRLALRFRGGYATSGTPLQSQFSVGGIGSVRSYGQNAVRGTRMLLANVEYLIDGATIVDGLLDDVFVAGIADAGWAGQPSESFRVDEVLPSAGFSVGLDERRIRLDVTWPLRDVPASGSGPAIWLRIAPNF